MHRVPHLILTKLKRCQLGSSHCIHQEHLRPTFLTLLFQVIKEGVALGLGRDDDVFVGPMSTLDNHWADASKPQLFTSQITHPSYVSIRNMTYKTVLLHLCLLRFSMNCILRVYLSVPLLRVCSIDEIQ